MMANLWDYLTQPSRANKPIDYNNYADETLYNATAVPRFIANSGKSVYDSFKRGTSSPNLPDALNVAMGAMIGGTPGVPKGNNPSTLGMAFRQPKDVVSGRYLTPDIDTTFDKPKDAKVQAALLKYYRKNWGTADDDFLKHLDAGGAQIPPHLQGNQIYQELANIAQQPNAIEQLNAWRTKYPSMQGYTTAATTPKGMAYEMVNDALVRKVEPDMHELYAEPKVLEYLQKTPDADLYTLNERPDSPEYIRRISEKQEGNLNRTSLIDMLSQADKYDAELASQANPANQLKLHEFDDGHYWTQLKTQAQRDAESEAMGNSTRLPMHDGKELYSLRDKNGKSILTASRRPGYRVFDEVKTRFNERDILDELQLSNRKDNEYYDKYLGLFTKLGMDK